MGSGARPGEILQPRELAQLTDAWQIWAENVSTPGRMLTRARMHLFFLLARFGGLRPAEICALAPDEAFDLSIGTLNCNGRRMFLPAIALRSLRRILSLPESREREFLQLDASFVRRTFYAVSGLAGLPPASCAPRALRYARALELLDLNIAPHLVARALGFKDPLQLPSPGKTGQARGENVFAALLTRLETGNHSARLFLELPGRVALYCICGLDALLAVESAPGQMLEIRIPPGCILVGADFQENRLNCRICALAGDQFEILPRLRFGPGLELVAALDRRVYYNANLKLNQELAINIPAHAIELRIPDS